MLTMVCGLGRCGTSMVMQMLAAGGAQVVGRSPAFEVDQASRIPLDKAWLQSLGDQTVKVLDPHRTWRGQVPARAIWLDRDDREQARSQAKFMSMVGGVRVPAGAWKRIRPCLKADRKAALARLVCMPVLMLRFESILSAPGGAAEQLADWFPELDVAAAAAVVQRRSPACAGGMDLELGLLAMRGLDG